MGYLLGEGLSFCAVLDRYIFLDLPGDRYFCLGAEAAEGFSLILRGDALQAPDAAVERLVAGGILIPSAAGVRPRAVEPAAPTCTLLRSDDAQSALGALEALSRRLAAETSLRMRGLDRSIDRARRKCAGLPHAEIALSIGAATAFAGSTLLRSRSKRCVSISLATLDWLAARGHSASLIIGVKLHPFEAHCWVQIGDLLVNDEVDAIRPFVPILVV
jgi:hypothetical protein